MVRPVAIAESYPENMLLWSSEKLISILKDEHRLSQNALGNMYAELLVRWYFNQQATAIEDYLSQKLPKESINQYKNWRSYASPFQKPSQIFLIPQNGNDLSNRDFLQKVQYKAQRRFENLLGRCDGIIPVIREEADGKKSGCAILFRLENADDSSSCVIDLDDTPIPEWSNAVSELISELNLSKICVRLLFHSSVEKDLPYTGFSLQFPILMAYWRRNEQIPNYNPFTVVATGRIQDHCLAPVRLEGKSEGVKDIFGKIFFFYPDSDNTDNSEMVPIPVGTPVDNVLSMCNQQLVSRKNEIGFFSFGINHINQQLNIILKNVKKDLENTWDFKIKYLQQFLDELDEDQYPEHYLNTLLTLSFAYCHSANTAKAHDYNREAIKFANRVKSRCNNIQYQLILLSIEEMVLLQDEENFEQIPKLASEIKDQLDTLDENDIKTFDLKMRYYGTLGQAHMCGAVCQIEGFDKDIALNCISEAINYARKYQDNTEEDNIDEVIRDMNYRHLWYAMFNPGSKEEQKYYNLAVKETIEKQSPGNSKDNNLSFQFRQHCLSSYRQIIMLCDNPNTACADEPIPAPNNIQFWLKALIYKYQAAVLAFLHRGAEAQKKFDESFVLMENVKYPLFQYIAMTIAAEAYQSFSILGDEQTAEQYRKKALRLFEDNNDFQDYKTSASWKQYLITPWKDFDEPRKHFPGRHFYY